MFQDPVLLPWRTAAANVRLPCEILGTAPGHDISHVERFLRLVGLEKFEQSLPHQLSGGMQQRVSIARALAVNPAVLLMDEPFSALDELTRNRVNNELLRIWASAGVTIVFDIHSLSEAVFLADRVAIFSRRPGTIQCIVPIELSRPRTMETRFSASFVKYCEQLFALLDEQEMDNG